MYHTRRPTGNWRDRLALERNVSAAAGALFLLGFGEELWRRYVPKYLEALGAGPGLGDHLGVDEVHAGLELRDRVLGRRGSAGEREKSESGTHKWKRQGARPCLSLIF